MLAANERERASEKAAKIITNAIQNEAKMKREEESKKKHKIVKKHKHSRKKNVKHLQWQFKKKLRKKNIIKNNKLKLNNIYTYDERCRLMFLFDIDVCM